MRIRSFMRCKVPVSSASTSSLLPRTSASSSPLNLAIAEVGKTLTSLSALNRPIIASAIPKPNARSSGSTSVEKGITAIERRVFKAGLSIGVAELRTLLSCQYNPTVRSPATITARTAQVATLRREDLTLVPPRSEAEMAAAISFTEAYRSLGANFVARLTISSYRSLSGAFRARSST